MKIKYNEKEYDFENGSLLDFLKQNNLYNQNMLVADLNNNIIDLNRVINPADYANNQKLVLKVYSFKDEQGKKVFWHTSAHILAQAITRIFPNAKLAIGPAIDEGFYYDVDVKLDSDDIKKIEDEMNKIIDNNYEIKRESISYDKAKQLFIDNPYKIELIEQYHNNLSIYRQAEFFDLCRGPHLLSTGYVKAIAITKLAGAYWRGNSKNKMLTRVYGISFPSKKELREYFNRLEEAKKRDHRLIGQQLDLFSFHHEGPGFVFWHHKGMIIRNLLVELWRKTHYKEGYQEISTPIILNEELWHRSGHWDHYKENMYFTKIDDHDYAIKPMNCPGGILVYSSRPRSYKEFPLKLGEFGLVHRHELSGVLHGLMRVRAFTQDDAHVFCEPDQLKKEISDVVKLIDDIYRVFGFEYYVEISTRPENRVGTDELWDKAEKALEDVCKEMNLDYKINEGDGAFYGPKIDFHIKDSLNRTWQCATVQLDFNMPQRFNLKYMGKDGTANHVPVMLHRVVYGSLERFIGILIEHYAGKLPLWLNPTQIKIIAVADRHKEKAITIGSKITNAGFRVEYDFEALSVSKKVRNAELQKVNYILVIGDRDDLNSLSIRTRDSKVLTMNLDRFLEYLNHEKEKPFEHLEIKM